MTIKSLSLSLLEILFAVEEPSALGGGVFVAHLVKRLRKRSRATEELHKSHELHIPIDRKREKTYHSNVGLRVLLTERPKDTIPVGSTKVRRRTKRGDRVLLSADILDDNVVDFVVLQPGGKVDVDLDTVLRVLFFDGVQEGVEPLGSAKVLNDPGEVYL